MTAPDGAQGAIVDWIEPLGTDNSGIVPVRTSTHNPGTVFNVGTTTVVYTFTDVAGNQAQCTFNVIVTGKLDYF